MFLLRAVLGFDGGGCRLTVGGNGLCLSFFPCSTFIFGPATNTATIIRRILLSLGRIIVLKPQESSQPHPQTGVYIVIYLFSYVQECENYVDLVYPSLFYSGCSRGVYIQPQPVSVPSCFGSVFPVNACGSRLQYWSRPI